MSEIKIERPFDGVFLLNEDGVRSSLIIGNGAALLIDCGGTGADVCEAVAGVTDLSPTLVLTHGDIDHMACLHDFDSAFAHRDDFDRIRDARGFGVDLKPVCDGDIFDLGDRELEVLHIPGHTPGSIALLDRKNRLLFSGDSVSLGPIFMFGEGRSMEQLIKSLERLQAESDAFDLIIPSHNASPLPASRVDDDLALCRAVLAGELTGQTPPVMGLSLPKCLFYTLNDCGVLY